MKNLLYLAFGVLLLIAITIVFVVIQNNTTPTDEPDSTGPADGEQIIIDDANKDVPQDQNLVMGATIIVYTNNGFEPKDITVSAGDTVTFVNESDRVFWPASAVHPIHTVYPGSGLSKCNAADVGTIFDACGSVGSGGQWQFQFDEVGTWGYHNHLRASHTGKITVE